MGQVNAVRVARRLAGVEDEGLALLQHHAAVLELADAELRALEVGEDADRPSELLLDSRGSWRRARASCRASNGDMLMRNTSAPASNSRAIVS